MLAFGPVDIARSIEPATLTRGRIVHARGRVIDVDVSDGGTVIVGRVRGSEPRPYQLMISLRPSNNGVIIQGTCSCFMRSNCKHVAAVLIEAERRAPPPLVATAVPSRPSAGRPSASLGRSLSPQLQLWLGELDEACAASPAPNQYPPEIKQRLLYVLDLEPGANGFASRASLTPMVASLLQSGKFGSSRIYSPSNIYNYQPAKHLRPVDHEILGELDWLLRRTPGTGLGNLPLTANPMVARVLSRILSTGRCRWREVNGPELNAGPVRRARPRWRLDTGARQRLVIELEPETVGGPAPPLDAVLGLVPPYYVDVSAGLTGPLDLGLPEAIAARLAVAPSVSAAEAAALAVALEPRVKAMGLTDRVPLPKSALKTEVRTTAPVPRLELLLASVRIKPQYSWCARQARHRGSFQLPLARLAFDYAGEVVPAHAAAQMLERLEGDVLVITPRDGKLECAALERLGALGLKGIKDGLLETSSEHANDLLIASGGEERPDEALAGLDDPTRFIAFSAEAVPLLRSEGWQIAYSDDYPYRMAEGEVAWWADLGEGSGIDWFSFELGIEFEGQRISLAPQLASMLSRLPAEVSRLALSPDPTAVKKLAKRCARLTLYHTLPDGRLLPLPGDRMAPILKGLIELIGPRNDAVDNGRVKLHRSEAAALAAWADELGSSVAWGAGTERLIALGQELKRGRGMQEATPPPSFRAKLRPYQALGLSWLDFLRETGFGGVLADDMGLGKTVQALAFLAREKNEGRLDRPALIVAPTSVLPNWQAEAERFVPTLDVLALRGLDRKQLFGDIAHHDLVLTTYPLLMRDHGVLLAHEFHVAILDEAQAIKNPRATVAGLAHRINARHRLALTGTPLENNLGEVWSLFEFLCPGLLGDETTFRRTFRTPIEKHGDRAAQAFLTRRLKPFMLRRTKQQVAKELPAKTEIVERVRLDGSQRDLYETVRVLMHERVRHEITRKGLAKSHIVFLDALLKLRQICCDPRLLKMPQARKAKQSAKLERLMEMIPVMVAEGRRILLFSQFTSMLELIAVELQALDIPYLTLTGDTVDRARPVKAFQAGESPLFLLSLKAGGSGLNLTAADTVIHYDPWWNPAVEDQATARAYRIGQTKPVFVYKLIVDEGIEEAIQLLKARKAALAEALFEGVSKSGLDFTEADISALFAPLDGRTSRRAA
ncbi:MAG TPA: DEAD/DEAH box helicase [Hyphomicrobiaceae bacterium]|nr:DEAD/DEAH box helicase [Hyphomicrobiaceae bacterium]